MPNEPENFEDPTNLRDESTTDPHRGEDGDTGNGPGSKSEPDPVIAALVSRREALRVLGLVGSSTLLFSEDFMRAALARAQKLGPLPERLNIRPTPALGSSLSTGSSDGSEPPSSSSSSVQFGSSDSSDSNDSSFSSGSSDSSLSTGSSDGTEPSSSSSSFPTDNLSSSSSSFSISSYPSSSSSSSHPSPSSSSSSSSSTSSSSSNSGAVSRVYGQQFSGIIPSPAHLDRYAVSVADTLTPYSPSEDTENTGEVGPYTTGPWVLMYTGEDGKQYTAENDNVQIDNAMRQAVSNGTFIMTLADIFAPYMPVPPDASQAIIAVALSYRLTLIVTNFDLTAPVTYVTDLGRPVQYMDRGRTLAMPNRTADEVKSMIDENDPGLYEKVTPLQDPTWSYNCHGLTFTGGDDWVNDDQVPTILIENGYKDRPAGQVKAGDIVIYKKDGKITHTGIVVEVDDAGNAKTIESKWGGAGLYLHAPGDVPRAFGDPTVMYSDRGGNTLKTN